MARLGNSIHASNETVDLSTDNIKVVGIILTGASGVGTVSLSNNPSSATLVARIDVPSGITRFLDMSDTPLRFPNGIRVIAGATSDATIIIREMSGG